MQINEGCANRKQHYPCGSLPINYQLIEQINYKSKLNRQDLNSQHCPKKEIMNFYGVKQTNHENSYNNEQVTSLENFASAEQSNMEGSFRNIQRNYGNIYTQIIQNNEKDSAGNMQINFGQKETTFSQYVDQGYSFNLQMNILECGPGEKDKISTLRGNIRIDKCTTTEDDIYHDDGDVFYKINYITRSLKDCIGLGQYSNYDSKFMNIVNGKVHIFFC
jgi:hypothetical protein